VQARDGFGFQSGHAEGCAFEAGRTIEGADGLKGRAAIEYDHGLYGEVGAQAQKGLGGELFGVNAGVKMSCHAQASL
jgi:hypothetical protein